MSVSRDRGLNTILIFPAHLNANFNVKTLKFADLVDHPHQRAVEENWVDYLSGAVASGSRPPWPLFVAYWDRVHYLFDGKQRKTALAQEHITEYRCLVFYPKTKAEFDNLFIGANYSKLVPGNNTALGFGGKSGDLIRELYRKPDHLKFGDMGGTLFHTDIDPATAAAAIYTALTGREKSARCRTATTMDELARLLTPKSVKDVNRFVADLKALLGRKSYKTVAVILGAEFHKDPTRKLWLGGFSLTTHWDRIGAGWDTYPEWHAVIGRLYR